MPVIGARTAADFASGAQQNTRVRFDGQVELASRNLLSNPDARDLDELEDPLGLYPGAAGEPQGWGVYIRKAGDPRTTRQTLFALPMARDFYTQNGPLVEGPTPQDVTRRARIAAPREAPWCEAVARAFEGYVAGWRALAYGWILGSDPGRSPFITDPSPRVAINLATGEGADLPLPEAAPEGATGIYVAMTEVQTTENAAMVATLWIQRRLDVRRGMRATYPLRGPFRREERAPAQNETYTGGANEWPPPRRHFYKSAERLQVFTTRLSWSFLTEFGWSKPQGMTGQFTTPSTTEEQVKTEDGTWVPLSFYRGQVTQNTETRTVTVGWKAKLGFYPAKVPKNARAWRPEFLGADGSWYAMKPLRIGTVAFILSNDPEDFPEGERPEAISRGVAALSGEIEDATGIPAPDAAPETPLITLSVALEPGTYEVRAVFYDEEERETPPSPPRRVTIALGQAIKVVRPVSGNLIPNAHGGTVDPATGESAEWELIPTARFVARTIKGGVVVTDSSGSALNEDSSLTPLARLPEKVLSGERRAAIRCRIRMDRYVSGAVAVQVRFHNPDRSLSQQAQVAKRTTSGVVKGSMGVSGTGAAITIPSWATHARLVTRQVGAEAEGVRDLDYTASAWAFFRGLTAPRTYPRLLWPKPAVEDPEDLYPDGGTCVLVEDPQERHADLAGMTLNAIEYWGPDGTPKSHEYFLGTDPVTGEGSYRTPVRAGQTYTLSAYVSYEGVSVPTEYFVTAVKDAKGRVLLTNPPLVPNVSGDAPPSRHAMTFTAPAGASFVEIVSGGGSDGFARAMAFQLEEGVSPTAYTNENALSGYRRITLDTGLPRVPAGSDLAFLGEVAAWISGGAVYTNDSAATSVAVSFRSTGVDPRLAAEADWSAWSTDFDAVPRRRYWQIEVTLSTTDPLRSPTVSWVGLEVARGRPVLLRGDGSEYPGGVQVVDMPARVERRKRETFVADSNARGHRASGRFVGEIRGFSLEAYLDEAVAELLRDMYEEDLTQVIEDFDLGRRYTVIVDPETVSFEVERDAYWTFSEPRHYFHRASGAECVVLEEGPLA